VLSVPDLCGPDRLTDTLAKRFQRQADFSTVLAMRECANYLPWLCPQMECPLFACT